jgi:(p)ppGpp synthase/HD superfamily hydrolase
MTGYSDPINHAFAFAAKYYPTDARRGSGLTYLTRPANLAVILARYGCDEATIVAGILHHTVEETPPDRLPELERKVGEKFGSVVLAVVKDVTEPRYDARGGERPWQTCKLEYLAHLGEAEPRALDICAGDEIHYAGSLLADLRRLGVEYLRTISKATPEQTLWWSRSVLDALARHDAWPRREMLVEMRGLALELARELRTGS